MAEVQIAYCNPKSSKKIYIKDDWGIFYFGSCQANRDDCQRIAIQAVVALPNAEGDPAEAPGALMWHDAWQEGDYQIGLIFIPKDWRVNGLRGDVMDGNAVHGHIMFQLRDHRGTLVANYLEFVLNKFPPHVHFDQNQIVAFDVGAFPGLTPEQCGRDWRSTGGRRLAAPHYEVEGDPPHPPAARLLPKGDFYFTASDACKTAAESVWEGTKLMAFIPAPGGKALLPPPPGRKSTRRRRPVAAGPIQRPLRPWYWVGSPPKRSRFWKADNRPPVGQTIQKKRLEARWVRRTRRESDWG